MVENMPILPTRYDNVRCRHVAGDQTLVLHCHHFAALTTQLANDCSLLDAKKLLGECSEDAFYTVLTNYYRDKNIKELRERIAIGERYFAEAGLGCMNVVFAGWSAGEVELKRSHVDEGWVKKWGASPIPVNHIGCGYVTAMFSAIFDRQKRTYLAAERQSIACGADVSVITVTDIEETCIREGK